MAEPYAHLTHVVPEFRTKNSFTAYVNGNVKATQNIVYDGVASSIEALSQLAQSRPWLKDMHEYSTMMTELSKHKRPVENGAIEASKGVPSPAAKAKKATKKDTPKKTFKSPEFIEDEMEIDAASTPAVAPAEVQTPDKPKQKRRGKQEMQELRAKGLAPPLKRKGTPSKDQINPDTLNDHAPLSTSKDPAFAPMDENPTLAHVDEPVPEFDGKTGTSGTAQIEKATPQIDTDSNEAPDQSQGDKEDTSVKKSAKRKSEKLEISTPITDSDTGDIQVPDESLKGVAYPHSPQKASTPPPESPKSAKKRRKAERSAAKAKKRELLEAREKLANASPSKRERAKAKMRKEKSVESDNT